MKPDDTTFLEKDLKTQHEPRNFMPDREKYKYNHPTPAEDGMDEEGHPTKRGQRP